MLVLLLLGFSCIARAIDIVFRWLLSSMLSLIWWTLMTQNCPSAVRISLLWVDLYVLLELLVSTASGNSSTNTEPFGLMTRFCGRVSCDRTYIASVRRSIDCQHFLSWKLISSDVCHAICGEIRCRINRIKLLMGCQMLRLQTDDVLAEDKNGTPRWVDAHICYTCRSAAAQIFLSYPRIRRRNAVSAPK